MSESRIVRLVRRVKDRIIKRKRQRVLTMNQLILSLMLHVADNTYTALYQTDGELFGMLTRNLNYNRNMEIITSCNMSVN